MSFGGGFGQPQQAGGFGQPVTGAFGQKPGGFGQSAGPAGFGQPQAGGFGQPQQTGGFGQPQQAGGFGQPAAGGFGQPQQLAGGFGQPQQQAGGFGQPHAGGFGQPQQQVGGFGQPAAGGFGQPQQQAGGFGQKPAGGFGQPAAPGGFGQPQQAGGFGQPAAGGFGQPQQTGGFGQPQQQVGGFGQPAAGGFGQPQQQAGGFGQKPTGGFGQPQAGGFGQQQVGGFGQPAAGGFGQPASGGFGQPQQQAGGFGQKPAGGFGQPAAPGGFGQPQQQVGGFGQPAAGGFGQPAAGGFGQPAAGGFGQPASGGFGQPQQQAGGFGQKPAGGFGQPAAPGGFGQPQQQVGGFGQPAAGGFGQPAAGGFGQPAAGGFGQPQQQAGGFGQKPAGGFGQPQQPAAGGFGQTATPVGGFGQPAAGGFGQPAAGGFGQQPTPAVGFGQPQGGGFGQATTGGFGQPARPTTGFGAPTGGFSQPAAPAGTFGVAAAPGPAAPSAGLVFQPTDLSFMTLPDFNSKPYGDVLLYARYDKPEIPKPTADPLENVIVTRPSVHSWWTRNPVPDPDVLVKQHTAAFNASSVSAAAIKDLLNPSIQMGVGVPVEAPSEKGDINFATDPIFHLGETVSPLCRNPDYTTVPPMEELNRMTTSELRHVCNFQVRRRDGKAIIHFLEPVNLVRVDIAEAVLISRDGHVQLYPHQTPPSPGTGLNVTARVTVHDVWNTNEDALRERCRAGKNRFISYSHHTWVYEMGTGCSVSPARPSIEPENENRMSIVDEEEEEGVATLDSLRKSHVSTTLVEPPVSGQLIRPPVRVQIPFDLPYAVPNMSKKDPIAAPDVVLSLAKVTLERPAYYLDKKESEIYAKIVSRQKTEKGSSVGELCRSYRAGWRGDGVLAAPAFAELHDGLEEHPDVRETRGAHVSLMSPYVWHKPSTKPLTVCLVAVLRHVLQYVTVTAANDAQGNEAMKVALSKGHYGLAVIGLSREKTSVSLSEEKLEHVLWPVRDSVPSNLSTTEARSLRQFRSVVTLLSAMYGLPETDVANANPMEESRYLRQLRHRNLATWLRAELTDLVSASTTSFKSKAEELVQIMLCHRLREAREVVKELNSEDLVRVVRVCGEGNQFGSYVAMAKTGFRDGAEVRERVVSLLSGRVEPFMEEEYIMRADSEEVSANSRAATWKQLLGIFVFYGCTPDTPAEDIICSFMDRLEQPATHRPNSLAPYAEKIEKEVVQTRRGADAARRGHTFQDAAMLILKGYAAGTAPPAMCLHPHSSSYCSMDYLTPLIILLAVRALQLPRDRCYMDAEISVLLGAAAALETNDETWYWGLLPLHLIECDADRWQAVRDFCYRNAKRASCMTGNPTKSELRKIIEVLCVDETALRPIVITSEERKEASRNMPSIKTHEALQQAMKRLTVSPV